MSEKNNECRWDESGRGKCGCSEGRTTTTQKETPKNAKQKGLGT